MFRSGKPKLPPLRRLLLPGIATLLILLEIIALIPNVTTPLERIDLTARDTMFRLRGEQDPGDQIVIVGIDDFSLNWSGKHWPWPRADLAEIVEWLNDAGARLIGLDVLLFEADPDPAGDEALAQALKDARASVSLVHIYDYREEVLPGQYLVTHTIELPLPVFRDALDGVGITSIWQDEDAIVRSIQAYQVHDNSTYIHWAFELARLYLDVDPVSAISSTTIEFNNHPVPLQAGKLLINYKGPAVTFPTYSATRVVLGDYPQEAFKDKIVLIGATSLTLQDVYPTPFSATEQTPGVEIVANAVATILSNMYLRSLPPWANLLFILGMALIAALLIRIKRPTLVLSLMVGLMLVYAVAAYIIFARWNWYIPTTTPELTLFLGVVLPTLGQAVSQELEKRRVRDLFTRFISPEMVDQLLTTQDINSLNKRANLTILFSDIRGFTTLSEKIPPEDVVTLLNPYLEAMTNVIHAHGGTVDKYEGDAIIAFFGEPVPYEDHALRAARAAVEMRLVLAELRERWKEEGIFKGRFEIGIGLNTGEAFVGLLGSAKRINYTVIGDNVNLASRLQDMTKIYGWPVIINESTAMAIQYEFDVEFIEAAQVKGKSEAVRVYKILGRKGAPESERVRELEM